MMWFTLWASEQIANSRPRRSRKLPPDLCLVSGYVTKHNKLRLYDFEPSNRADLIVCRLYKHERPRPTPKMDSLVWHDLIYDCRYHRIHAISRDSCATRRAILSEFVPVELANLIISCVWKPLRKTKKRRE